MTVPNILQQLKASRKALKEYQIKDTELREKYSSNLAKAKVLERSRQVGSQTLICIRNEKSIAFDIRNI
jgi:hypothetical protein